MICFYEQDLMMVLDEFLSLARENGKEVYGDNYNPDIPQLINLYRSGLFSYYVARDKGVLVGYALMFRSCHPHRLGFLCSECNSIFMVKGFREANFHNFMDFIIDQEKEAGVQQIDFCLPPRFRNFMKRKKFQVAEQRYRLEV